jgi:rfaE bifunctional protein nucleotidyltransferase chain/domain
MSIFYRAAELNRELQKLGSQKIVFTNGVFDLLHAGHIDLLTFAKGSGDCLIVGINDDHSVKRLKGQTRPIYPLAQRLKIVAALRMVDFVIPFSEDTPLELIKSLHRVDVLVKGGDYRLPGVVGREEVEKAGGKVLLFHFQTEISTSAIIKKIRPTRQD